MTIHRYPHTLPVTLTGESGRTYEFAAHPFGAEPRYAAVYAVLRAERSYWPVIYVGQAGHVENRFSNHHHSRGFKLYRATHVAVHREADESMRRAIEADLVGNYNPPLNKTNHG